MTTSLDLLRPAKAVVGLDLKGDAIWAGQAGEAALLIVAQLDEVLNLAGRIGLAFDRVLDMPNNNYVLILRQVRD